MSSSVNTDRIYTVKPGDTLSVLSFIKLGDGSQQTYSALATYNGIADPNIVDVGWTLRIPQTRRDLLTRVQEGSLALPSPDPTTVSDLDKTAVVRANADIPTAPIKWDLGPDAKVTSGYGARGPIPSAGLGPHFHPGIDIWWSGCNHAPIPAPFTGKVIAGDPSGLRSGYGKYCILRGTLSEGDTPFILLIAHMARLDVPIGNPVQEGDILGLLGSTGLSSGPHIHAEVQLRASYQYDAAGYTTGGGAWVDPAPYMTFIR